MSLEMFEQKLASSFCCTSLFLSLSVGFTLCFFCFAWFKWLVIKSTIIDTFVFERTSNGDRSSPTWLLNALWGPGRLTSIEPCSDVRLLNSSC